MEYCPYTFFMDLLKLNEMWEDVLTYNPLNMVEIFHYRQNNLVIMVKNSLITILFKGILIS